MYTRPSEPRSIGGVLDDGLRLWREAFPQTWLLAMFGQIVIAVPSIFLVDTSVDASRLSLQQKFSMMVGQAPGHLWIYYLLTFVSYIFHVAVLRRVAGVAEGRETTIADTLIRSVQLIPRILLFFIIFVCGAGLVGGVLGVFMGIASAASKSVIVSGVVAALLVAAVSYLIVRLFLGYIALVVDDRTALESLGFSWTLTRGNWWRTTAIATVVFIIVIVLSAAMYLIGGLFVATWGMLSMVTIVSTQLVSVLVFTVLGSLYPAALYAVYQDLKLRREGSDLAGRVNALAPQ